MALCLQAAVLGLLNTFSVRRAQGISSSSPPQADPALLGFGVPWRSCNHQMVRNSSEPANASERMMADYLIARGLRYGFEARVGDKNPDFTIYAPSGTVIGDVYDPRFQLPTPSGAFDTSEAISGFTRSRGKRGQAAAASDAGLPFVLILGSDGSDLPFDYVSVVLAAYAGDDPIFGNPTRRTRFSAVAVVSEFNPTYHLLNDAVGVVAGERPSLSESFSAAMEVTQALTDAEVYVPDARAQRVEVIHNPYCTFSLDESVFTGPYDTQRIAEGNDLLEIFIGPRVGEVP